MSRIARPDQNDRQPLRRERGLTLVEMLVVLAIIGISTATAVLAMAPGRDGGGQAEAQRLLARVQLAADAAMISDRSLALAITPTSYAVRERGDAELAWQPTMLGGLDEVHTLPANMRLAVTSGGASLHAMAGNALLPLDPDAGGQPFAVTLSRGAQRWTIDFDGVRARLSGTRPGAPS